MNAFFTHTTNEKRAQLKHEDGDSDQRRFNIAYGEAYTVSGYKEIQNYQRDLFTI